MIWKTNIREFDLSRHGLVMGILNLTVDSFSDGGRFMDLEAAVDHALQMEAEGAQVIDIGGESTRPGAEPVPRSVTPARSTCRTRVSCRTRSGTWDSFFSRPHSPGKWTA